MGRLRARINQLNDIVVDESLEMCMLRLINKERALYKLFQFKSVEEAETWVKKQTWDKTLREIIFDEAFKAGLVRKDF
jgi:hypothetical protein